MALELSKNPTVLVVNDTAFAHGGLLPEHGMSPSPPHSSHPPFSELYLNSDECRHLALQTLIKSTSCPFLKSTSCPFLTLAAYFDD
jgi:hypothetical protein